MPAHGTSTPPSRPVVPHLLNPGQVIAGYEVRHLVGRGGMGEVYRARQVSMDREVALKILSPHLIERDPAFAQRFIAEARAAGKLNHANIVHVHDVGSTTLDDGQVVHYFSMEFIEGESLQAILNREKRVVGPRLALAMVGVAKALEMAQRCSIVHRDIKPDNILITRDGQAKLADLGLATTSSQEGENQERDGQGRLRVLGTPLYLSPEQARAQPLDHRSDQYSLGATLFHCITGRPPYRGAEARNIMRAHVVEPVPDPADVDEDVDEAWRQLAMRLMSKLPEQRFAQASELVAAAEAAGRGVTLDELERRARGFTIPAWVWVLIGLGVVLGGGFYWLASGTSRAKAGVVEVPAQSAPAPVVQPAQAPAPAPATPPVAAASVAVPATGPAIAPSSPAVKAASVVVPVPATQAVVKPLAQAKLDPWKSLIRKLDAARAAMAYGDIKPAVVDGVAILESVEDKVLISSLADVADLAQAGDAALERAVQATKPNIVTDIDGRSTEIVVSAITATQVTFNRARNGQPRGAAVTVDRNKIGMPWPQLLDDALAGVDDAPRIRCASLWMMGLVAENAEYYAANPEDPMVKAMVALEAHRR